MRRLLPLVLLLFSAVPAHADRDIVYSAKQYRWSNEFYRDPDGGKPERTLKSEGAAHLYLVKASGVGNRRVTWGRLDDERPQWSANGRLIYFWRNLRQDVWRLCSVRSDGSGLKYHFTFTGDLDDVRLAPDCRRLVVTVASWPDAAAKWKSKWVDLSDGSVHPLPHVLQAAWSPDSRRLYLVRWPRHEILDITTGRRTLVGQGVWDPAWIGPSRIMGIAAPSAGRQSMLQRFPDRLRLRVVASDGRHIRTVGTSLSPDDYDNGLRMFHNTWLRVSGSDELVVSTNWGMSDGLHHAAYAIHPVNGTARKLQWGPALTTSPYGQFLLVASHVWVGPYKRGGARVGPLERLDLHTGRRKRLTQGLVKIRGADWRPSLHRKTRR
jgi:hypothetical protein